MRSIIMTRPVIDAYVEKIDAGEAKSIENAIVWTLGFGSLFNESLLRFQIIHLNSFASDFLSGGGIYTMMIKSIKSVVQATTRTILSLIISCLRFLFGFASLTHHHDDTELDDHATVIIEDSTEAGREHVLYAATRAYLCGKTNLYSDKFYVVGECKVDDLYQGVELEWRIFVDKNNMGIITKEWFELRFDEKHRDLVFDSYIPFVERKATEIKSKKRDLEVHTYSHCSDTWETKSLDHRSTFETIVMKEEVKRGLIDDLDLFIRKKDFYKRVGRHWIRNYLLYGPPGTGKTSLVAAMAKYLDFDVYDLSLSEVVKSDFDPRKLILRIMDCSIILVEDIDCSHEGSVVALSQLLNSLLGLCANGEPRIVIFTTNNKERLDPTLLCRMEMKIYMGHCCFEGLKTLASNYLGLSHDNDDPHRLYPDIKRLIDGQAVTPGQVAEELMKSENVDVALEGLVRTLEMKSLVSDKTDEDNKGKIGMCRI
ncbi:unnamed protein product [Thlaspi arvense]|uniref:AAA+ ATPase domain-containing protein n=1 Tax=Thlaspi arvense TaxID=13288 RepID=A0AAU9SXC9_THLAR|nr:unnamed protein product [Thlaspi arvense]